MRKIILFCLAVVIIAVAGQIYFKAQTNKRSLPVEGKIVCFGDSLTSGVGATEGHAYPDQLAAMISRPIINAGRSGDTTRSAAARLQSDVLSHAPAIVIVALGGNDLMRGISKDVAFGRLKAMVVTIQDHGALVVVGGIDVPLWGKGYGDMYRVLCRETEAVCVANILEDIWGQRSLMSDTIHPNDAGYRRMAEKFYHALKPYL
jgi:acyl-CoA thioesterase-1